MSMAVEIGQTTGKMDTESDDEERNRFFSVCAENKINAMIARMREYDESFDRPEEFENEAVSMAIKQHGLKNCKNQSPRDSCCDFNCEINENHCNQNVRGDSFFEESTNFNKICTDLRCNKECDEEDDGTDICSKNKMRSHCNISDVQNLAYKQNITLENSEFDDIDFLNEAVAVAIKKKGLSSSTCNALQ